jgi:cellulose synthase operon protein C
MGLIDRLASTLGVADAGSAEVREAIARALEAGAAGGWASAEAELLALLETNRDVPALHLALGEVRARRGNDEGAVQAFGRAVDLSSQAVDGWLGLGEALVRLGRVEPARDALRKVLSRTSDPIRRARAHAARGRLALARGEGPRAIRELRKAAELLPEDFAVAHDLGRALTAAGDEEGWSWLTRAAHAPTPEPDWVIAAADAAPDPAAAEELLNGALAARKAALDSPGGQPVQARLLAARARHLAAGGRAGEALPLARAAADAAPEDPAGQRALRLAHEAAGDYRAAFEAALGEARLGAPPPPSELIRLALGSEDQAALERVIAHVPEQDPIAPALRAFVEGRAREEDLLALGALGGHEPSRRFLARALAPGEVPAGNLFALLAFARDMATRTPELASLLPAAARAVEAFDRPLLVAVMGEFNAGKSSFVNALCGRAVAPVGATPTTATINVLRYGAAGGRVLYHDGSARELGNSDVAGFLGALTEQQAAVVRAVEIFQPLELLRQVEIVDTPGLNSLRPEHEAVAQGFLTEADAIVWLFSVGQAAKATEKDALSLAHRAGRRVLGVLNKADQVRPEEVETLTAHVLHTLGDRIEVLLPMSARQAFQAVEQDDQALRERSGLSSVLHAIEERFFSKARALKRGTALGALERFVAEARATAADHAPPEALGVERRRWLAEQESTLRGALAAERLRLRVRLEEAFRRAAGEVLELMRPRPWIFGERRAEPADHEFLLDLLEDAVGEATGITAKELRAAAAEGPPLAIDELVERFRAYVRGVLHGGLVERFFGEDLGRAGGRLELQTLQRALVARLPDSDRELIAPLEAAATAAYAEARSALGAEDARARMRQLLHEERLHRPLEALADAVRALEANA